MAKHIKLQKSESVVAAGAIQIYSAYIAAGRVPEGQEDQWMSRDQGGDQNNNVDRRGRHQ